MKNPIFKAKICLSSGRDLVDFYYSDNALLCELWLDEQVRYYGVDNVKSASVICISNNNNKK